MDFRKTYTKQLTFLFLYMLLTSIVFVPTLTYIYNRILRGVDSSSLLNTDVYTIMLSYTGFIGVMVFSFLYVIILFVQFGVMIILSQKHLFGNPVHIAEAFTTVLKAVPKMFALGIIQLMLFLYLLMPLIESPLTITLLESINLPILFTSRIHDFYVLVVLYVLLLLGIVYLLLRWIFVLHYIVIEGKALRSAFRASLKLTQSKRFSILIHLVILNALIYILGATIISVFNLVLHFFGVYMVTLSSYIIFIATLCIAPINIIFITRLFYQLKEQQGEQIEDLLKLKASKFTRLEQRGFDFFRQKKAWMFTLLVAYLCGVFMLNVSVSEQFAYLKWHTAVAAHRGDMGNAPENTISSIRAALDVEVEAVEIDVQLTRDGVVVLMHDITLSRVAGVPESVIDMTYDELMKLEVGSHFAEEFRGERIPTLGQAIETVLETDVLLIVEIKPYGDELALAIAVTAVIELLDAVDQVYIQSFSYEILQEIRRINSDILLGQVMYMATGNLAELDVDFYTINQTMLSDRFINSAHRLGRQVWVWTVNIDRNIRQVLSYDVDGIITDYPERVQQQINLRMD